MNLLSRIFRRTPSLRARVVVATAIGAAIPVLIVGTVVWVGITGDRKERLDRRLDEAAGFAIRSEEHTSELQSPNNLVCRLLLAKKKTPSRSLNSFQRLPSRASTGLFFNCC